MSDERKRAEEVAHGLAYTACAIYATWLYANPDKNLYHNDAFDPTKEIQDAIANALLAFDGGRVEKLESALQAMLAAAKSRDVKFGEMTILESAIKVGEAALDGRQPETAKTF